MISCKYPYIPLNLLIFLKIKNQEAQAWIQTKMILDFSFTQGQESSQFLCLKSRGKASLAAAMNLQNLSQNPQLLTQLTANPQFRQMMQAYIQQAKGGPSTSSGSGKK
ncbi:unnamed protein product [Meloidogyne enterolobii]|uniref:Uncharacterized protein n=1 Tax=Meloidogyne enterolobii TaxID=390850 RepID=A0ACB1AXL5_MELEN